MPFVAAVAKRTDAIPCDVSSRCVLIEPLSALHRRVGTSGLHRSRRRVPQLHADLGAARELPVVPHQGPGTLDVETEELLRPSQLRAGRRRAASEGENATAAVSLSWLDFSSYQGQALKAAKISLFLYLVISYNTAKWRC